MAVYTVSNLLESIIDSALYFVRVKEIVKLVENCHVKNALDLQPLLCGMIRLHRLNPQRNKPDSWAKFIMSPFSGQAEQLLKLADLQSVELDKEMLGFEQNITPQKAALRKSMTILETIQVFPKTSHLNNPRHQISDFERLLLRKMKSGFNSSNES